MGDDEVKDQAPAPGLIPKIVADLHIAAPLACACRDSITTCPAVRNNCPRTLTIQSCVLVAPDPYLVRSIATGEQHDTNQAVGFVCFGNV
jgi:hypothetical protein